MWRWVFIAFLFAHGFVHVAVWAMPSDPKKPAPFDASHSWVLGDAKQLAVALAVGAAVLFAIAGIGLLVHAGWWRPLTVLAAGGSVLLMTLYFNPWLVVGWGLSAGLVLGIVWLAWPSKTLVGA
jgi:hypothetical protein